MKSEGRTPCANHKEEVVNLDAHRKKKKEREDGEGHWAANEGERDISRDIKTLSRNICVGNGGG